MESNTHENDFQKYKLADARKAKHRTLGMITRMTGISKPVLSRVERGEWPTTVDQLMKICRAYDLDSTEVLRDWLFAKHGTTNEAKDGLAFALSKRDTSEDKLPKIQTQAIIQAASRFDALPRALNKVAQDLLTSLADYGEKSMFVHRNATDAVFQATDWTDNRSGFTAIVPDGRIECARIYSTPKPARFLAEVHRIPPWWGGLHRQPTSSSVFPGLEVFAVLTGKGRLLRVNADKHWIVDELHPGTAGVYSGGNTHVWLNVNTVEPLLALMVFFPLSAVPVGRNLQVDSTGHTAVSPGEGMEFSLDKLPNELNSDIREQVQKILDEEDHKQQQKRPSG